MNINSLKIEIYQDQLKVYDKLKSRIQNCLVGSNCRIRIRNTSYSNIQLNANDRKHFAP